MVNALVNIDDGTNRILNIVKARHGLKTKGEAIKMVVREYADMINEPELKPEFIDKLKKIEKQEFVHVDDFAKRYGLK